MNLQAKLTLGAVVLEVLIVGAISAENVASYTDLAFKNVLSRAKLVNDAATEAVKRALNANPKLTVPDALVADGVSQQLGKLMTSGRDLTEIAVVDPSNKVV